MGYFGVSWLEDGAKFNVVVTKKSKKQKTNPHRPKEARHENEKGQICKQILCLFKFPETF